MLIAAMCHDVEHDGFTNTYHVNAITERAIRYHDKAVQENWHASTAVRMMSMPENDFLENVTANERSVFRYKVISMILATDMGSHQEHLDQFRNRIESLGITPEKQNGNLFI